MSSSVSFILQRSKLLLLFYGLIHLEVNTENLALQLLLHPLVTRAALRPPGRGHTVPGSGACKWSSAAAVQQSALRWPASRLQRKNSISGQ